MVSPRSLLVLNLALLAAFYWVLSSMPGGPPPLPGAPPDRLMDASRRTVSFVVREIALPSRHRQPAPRASTGLVPEPAEDGPEPEETLAGALAAAERAFPTPGPVHGTEDGEPPATDSALAEALEREALDEAPEAPPSVEPEESEEPEELEEPASEGLAARIGVDPIVTVERPEDLEVPEEEAELAEEVAARAMEERPLPEEEGEVGGPAPEGEAEDPSEVAAVPVAEGEGASPDVAAAEAPAEDPAPAPVGKTTVELYREKVRGAQADIDAGRLGPAAAALREVLALEDVIGEQRAWALFLLAKIDRRRGNERAAVRRYGSAIDADPPGALYKNSLAWVLASTRDRSLQDPEAAVRLAEEAVRDGGARGSFLDTLARAYFEAGRLEDAVETQRRAVAKVPHKDSFRNRLTWYRQEWARASAILPGAP